MKDICIIKEKNIAGEAVQKYYVLNGLLTMVVQGLTYT